MFGMGTGVASPLKSPGFHACVDMIGRACRRLEAAGAPKNFIPLCAFRRDDVVTYRVPQLPTGQLLKKVKPSTISTAQLRRLPDFHMPPIEQVVSLRSYPVDPVGNLILRRASHLDAFSAYPDRT